MSPVVSVAVITYNSEKTIEETLDSIYNQTYPTLELIISDDCSSDNTVNVCKEWLSNKKERFIHSIIIPAKVNNGTSKNLNIAEAACAGEWVKPIAGDDILVNDCIEKYIKYITENNDVSYVFSRCKAFDAESEVCRKIDLRFDYNFFSLNINDQLKRLIFDFNCIPAPTLFYNRIKSIDMDVKNDERIPLLEDWPKWINLLKKNIRFHFIDDVLVLYRVNGVSTNSMTSVKMYESDRLFYFYYLFPEWCKFDIDYAVKRMVESEVYIYKIVKERESKSERQIRIERDLLLEENKYFKSQLISCQNSKAYKIGRIFLKPIKLIRYIFKI